MTKYPNFYLRGNIQLQEAIESFHKRVFSGCLSFLGFSFGFWLYLMFGALVSSPWFAFFGLIGLSLCAYHFYFAFNLLEDNDKELHKPF